MRSSAAVAPLIDTNGSTSIGSDFGTLLIDVQGVRQGAEQRRVRGGHVPGQHL